MAKNFCTKKADTRTTKTDTLLKLAYLDQLSKKSIRDIEKLTGFAKSTIQKRLDILKQKKIILDDLSFSNSFIGKRYKINFFIEKFIESGLIDYLVDEYSPSSIILFGSFSKGEAVLESDIDLFVESRKKDVSLSKYEQKLGHSIQIFNESSINKLPSELKNNIVNGIKLWGYFELR